MTAPISGTVGRSAWPEPVALCHRCAFASDAVDAFKPCPHCDGRLWPKRVLTCPRCDFYGTSRKAFDAHDCEKGNRWEPPRKP